MSSWWDWLLDSQNYMPHGHCYLWQRDTLWMNVGGDSLVAMSYLAIPGVLYYFARRRRAELPYWWMPLLFAAFILLCGFTHLFDIWTVWNPDYRLEGVLKIATGVVSATTAVALIGIMPAVMQLQTPAALQREVDRQTAQLAEANARLRREIEAREATEAQLRASEQRFQLAALAIRGYIYEARPGEPVQVSAGFEEVLGYAPAEVTVTRDWWATRLHPEDAAAVQDATRRATEGTGDSYRLEYRIRHRAGHYVWVWDHGLMQRDAQGRVLVTVGNVLEISELKRAEAERAEALEREQAARAAAERANRAKDEFLGTLSHELRTPISTIRTWARILQASANDAQQVGRGAEIIERNATLQTRLIGDLLDVNRILVGKMRLDLVELELGPLIQGVVENLRPVASARGIRLECSLDGAEACVLGDETRLSQIVWNLLSNALKFTPRGGQVRVALELAPLDARLVVQDSGQGIDPAFLPRLFQRFEQADATTTRESEGLGLGLALVRHLVEMHGGRVTAHSVGRGHGSTFTVELPLARQVHGRAASTSVTAAALPPGESHAARDAAALQGRTILVVDDQPDAADGTAHLIAAEGAAARCAYSADEALEQLAREPVDVVVADLGMPRKDGYALLAEARAAGYRGPVIAFSAYARDADRARAREAGFVAYLTKPATPAELVQTIVDALATRG